MSAPDAATFLAHTAELDRLAANLAMADRVLDEALTMLAEAETRLRQILADDGDGIAALASMEHAAAGVHRAETEFTAALAHATAAVSGS